MKDTSSYAQTDTRKYAQGDAVFTVAYVNGCTKSALAAFRRGDSNTVLQELSTMQDVIRAYYGNTER